ncbi:MAG TPA: GtrA family protein [Rhizomicrobium sp.]|nr:GtrA family protein [Rhizomicrobium sp.]
MSTFLRFALVGGAGFFVNAGAFWIALHLLYLSKDLAWFFAFVPAVTFTWWGNRAFTFHEHASTGLRATLHEWARFVLTNGFGAIVNYAVYEALIHWTGMNPFVALAAGVLAGLVFNFTLSKRVVFKPQLSSPASADDSPREERGPR